MAQYVYTMNRVGKIVPPKRQILKDISLSFFPGAKIGVLGLNGSGKSTLLKIMAGVDKEYEGEAMPMPGLQHRLPAAGAAARSRADRARERSRRASATCSPRRSALDEVYAAYAEPDADFDKLAAEQAQLEAIIAAAGADTGACSWRSPPTRCACRRGTRRSASCPAARSAASRCAGCCCPSPTCCCSTSRPTTSTPRASSGSSSSCSASPAPWSRSPTIATSSTTPPSGSSSSTAATAFRGRATTASWLEQKEQRLEQRSRSSEDARIKAMKKELEWVRQNPKGAPGQEQGAPRALRGAVRRTSTRSATRRKRSSSRWPSASATR